MLRYLRPAGGGPTAASLAADGAYFVAAITADHPAPWWLYVLLFGLAVLGGIGYIAGQTDSRPRESATAPAATMPQAIDVAETDEYFVTEPTVMPSTDATP